MLKWSAKPPTKTGFYWIRHKIENPHNNSRNYNQPQLCFIEINTNEKWASISYIGNDAYNEYIIGKTKLIISDPDLCGVVNDPPARYYGPISPPGEDFDGGFVIDHNSSYDRITFLEDALETI